MSVLFKEKIDQPVLVTGGAGFIGSHLVEALVNQGLKVRVLDNLSGGKLANLSKVSGAKEFFEFIKGDIRDRDLLENVLGGVGLVFHLAAMSSVPRSQLEPSLCLEINGQGSLNLMELAAKLGVKRLVYASSSAVYGTLPAPHGEDLAPSPDSPYAVVKLMVEHLGRYFYESTGLETISLRFFNVYGPRQTASGSEAGVIPIFFEALKNNQAPLIYGNGRQTRDFIHVADVVRALILAAQVKDPGPSLFNVGTGRADSILELLSLIKERFPGSPPPLHGPARLGDPLQSVASMERARAFLNFQAQVGLREGLSDIWPSL
ncbi:MAG: NAD-dependent epimerase/dehydratase family protein [Deltaproteobacteria bacterium]|nr:NAD-dependent epimerase/dehydratase family protein [Deltaproteobacteria bacterium]